LTERKISDCKILFKSQNAPSNFESVRSVLKGNYNLIEFTSYIMESRSVHQTALVFLSLNLQFSACCSKGRCRVFEKLFGVTLHVNVFNFDYDKLDDESRCYEQQTTISTSDISNQFLSKNCLITIITLSLEVPVAALLVQINKYYT
jgi:hypothetical protein